jgi:HSP20 family protein
MLRALTLHHDGTPPHHHRREQLSVVRWDPFRELEEMSDRLNRVFARGALARPSGSTKEDAMTVFDWAPNVDIMETPEEFQIKAELPDVKKEDVKVSVDAGVLRIEGERKQEKEEKGKKYHRIERSYGAFLRTFSLPDTVDESKVQADFKDGILNIRLHKSAKPKPKSIEIKVA